MNKMLDFLNKVQIIDEGNYKSIMENQVEPYLERKRKDGFFASAGNVTIHYEAYEKLLSRGSIVILHGFTESAEKFREIAYYFRKAGYSVFVPDLRGHGKSYHGSGKNERIETDSFDSYVEDLDRFIKEIVKPATGEKKIHIYSHSLGSTVSLLYLMKYPYDVEKVILSSPMICGNMGMPTAVAGTAAKLVCLFGGKNISAPGRCVFDSELTFENSDATSKARFEYYHEKRKNEPLYQTSGPSFGWVKASLEARDRILSAQGIKSLSSKLLIFKPEEDKQLLGQYTDMLADKADIKTECVKNSKHEIFMSSNSVLDWYIEKILDFIDD